MWRKPCSRQRKPVSFRLPVCAQGRRNDARHRERVRAYVGWRFGISVDEADPYAEEALRYARKFADDETGPELLMHYGRFKAQIGSADAYAALMEEALAMPTTDLGRTATFQACLAQAHWMSGLLLKAEAACDAALSCWLFATSKGSTELSASTHGPTPRSMSNSGSTV